MEKRDIYNIFSLRNLKLYVFLCQQEKNPHKSRFLFLILAHNRKMVLCHENVPSPEKPLISGKNAGT